MIYLRTRTRKRKLSPTKVRFHAKCSEGLNVAATAADSMTLQCKQDFEKHVKFNAVALVVER